MPCVDLAHLTTAQRRAYIIADNKLAENAGWDAGVLKKGVGERSSKLRPAYQARVGELLHAAVTPVPVTGQLPDIAGRDRYRPAV